MPISASDRELLARQAALQAEAGQVLAELDLGRRFADVGPVLVVGSYLSGLMCWRDLDVCLLAGVECSPSDVLELLKRVVELPGFVGFTYRDERGERGPTGEARDERYHVPFDLDAGQGRWRIDLSVWLRDLHGHVADWHVRLRDTIDDQQRLAVLRIKDVWHRLPTYPDEVSGWEIYTAVLRDGVRTPEQFARWLVANGFPGPGTDREGSQYMTEPISARQFHLASGVGDWRVADGGACAYFHTGSFGVGARFVQAVSELDGLDEHAPDLDLRPDGVFVRLFTTAPAPDGLSRRDLELARRISAAAHQLGLTAQPSEVQNVVVTIDALDIAQVFPFWRAVLGYHDRGDSSPVAELNDPHRRKPVVGFQQMEAPRPQRNRVHLDVWVPHDQAEARVAAAVAAGGRVVSNTMAPSWWVLADPEGNEACIATWIGTDGLGYP